MKSKILIAAVFLASFAILLHRFEKPVMAQVRAALVKNIDERGRSPYSLSINCAPVSGSNYCQGTSGHVPANKRFVVEYVNGYVSVPGGPFGEGILSGGSGPKFLLLDPHLVTSNFAYNSYVINTPVVAYYEGDATASVEVLSPNGGVTPNGNISMTGYLVDLSE